MRNLCTFCRVVRVPLCVFFAFLTFSIFCCLVLHWEVKGTSKGNTAPLAPGEHPGSSPHCGPVAFSQRPLLATALSSFPGSGSTWLRYLVQEVTGILTGSEYYDLDLYDKGFLGEGVSNSSTILVKTHGSDEMTRDRYRRAILVIRHPKDALVAEFNRQYSGDHFSEAAKKYFHKYWSDFLSDHAKAWYQFHRDWLSYPRPLLVLRYADMASHPAIQLRKIFHFFKIKIKDDRLQCALQSIGHLKRRWLHPHSAPTDLYRKDIATSLDKMYLHVLKEFDKRAKRL